MRKIYKSTLAGTKCIPASMFITMLLSQHYSVHKGQYLLKYKKAVHAPSGDIKSDNRAEIKILVAMHKKYRVVSNDIYLPIHVGKDGKSLDLGIQTDNTGDNISIKNPYFCELTALYWAWKNLDTDYIGLVHYRRLFVSENSSDKWDRILTRTAAEALLQKTDVILPQKRRYYIESNYSHYIHGHTKDSLDKAIEILRCLYPDYSQACSIVMKRSWAHMFNMFIMKKELLDNYCDWLFCILFKLEKELDISAYSAFEARVFGRISELFLDIWIERNNIGYVEVPILFMESQNWLVKGIAFIGRKFGIVKINEKY